MTKTKFSSIYRNRIIDPRTVRFHAILMTANSEGGISIPLAQAITRFILTGIHSDSYEKNNLEDVSPSNVDLNN